MSYSICLRKYYYENILGGRYAEYANILEVKLQEKNTPDGLIKENNIKATDKGLLVHKVLEHMDKQ
jgi:hypothetical protein